ncbi:MAG: transcription-repair coupling factor, partial [Angelakisella sp.]
MNNIARQIARLPEYSRIEAALDGGKQPVLVTGVTQVHKAQLIHAFCTLREQGLRSGALVITPDEQTAARLCEEINLFEGAAIAWQYPERELTLRPVEGVSREYEHMRLSVLVRLLSGRGIAVASAAAALQLTIPPQKLQSSLQEIRPGQELPQKQLLQQLLWAGYQRGDQVEGLSQFATRGGIVDFFPPDSAMPVRVEYWGDEIDTVSSFSLETQRREQSLESAIITPAREVLYLPEQLTELLEQHLLSLSPKQLELGGEGIRADILRLRENRSLPAADRYLSLLYKERSTLLSYAQGRMLFVSEGISVKEAATHQRWQQDEEIKQLLEEGVLTRGAERLTEDYEQLSHCYSKLPTVLLDSFPRSYPSLKIGELVELKANPLSVWSGELSILIEELENYLADGYCCMVLAGTSRGAAALADDLRAHKLNARYTQDRGEFQRGAVLVCEGGLSSGVEYPQQGLAILTYGRAAHIITKKKQKKAVPKGSKAVKDIADLSEGDYVVHSAHGIGVFEGIVKKEVQGVIKDYIKIRYAGTDTLFVPVTQLDLVTKYIGGKEDASIRLSKLNSAEWSKTRQRVKKAVSDMAKELISLYAKRLQAKGFPFAEDTEWQKDFEQRFEYDETDDQLRCITEIKDDMERAVPMDRLLCGDVGFGKTEVALRAIFKCVMDSKQCAVMVPTTILAWQHYQTFLRRLEGYPITVELLSRFRTPKQQKEIIRRLKSGEIDVVVGTHKLVQKDVEFKDLGLCVIDEEQRFGVAHKERFKELRSSVDVLTLSATPIPRTLNMAMSGIRDMSVIGEAPQDRHPVQTYVLEYDEPILMEAIRKELRRGGQVFYLHNRVDSIGGCAAKIQEAIPDARIQTAHGRMGEEELSKVWKNLVEREIDILVCTTIIETGVDVPNCNTLIIEDADRMGLSQLYQLRGRVGRSERRAYAYFTFRRGRVLTEVGEKRLAAIREFTSFGSGFRIAMRDLEIRGAGDILGSQQHGQMEAVGYDLYLKLLSDAISEEKGEAPSRNTECLVDLPIGAHIPEEYIGSLPQRVDIYKKIACVYTQEDYMDTMDELIDRFGDPPDVVKGLLDVAIIRNSAAAHGIQEITQRGNSLLLYPETLDMEKTIVMVQRMRGRVLVNAGQKPYISVKLQKGQPPLEAIREVLGVMDEQA